MSFNAIRWAMEQPAHPALTKFCLVAMAQCVNSDGAEAVCWPSYAHLCRITGMNTKTVEQAVSNLKTQGYIVDTGMREGGTGKVVVYRLNTPKCGGVTPGPQTPSANGTRPDNTPESGCVKGSEDGAAITPNTAANPPNFDGKSPQIPQVMTPKAGAVIRKEAVKESGRESGLDAACAALPEVPKDVLRSWLPIRAAKRAGPVSEIVANALRREAAKSSLSPSEAVTYCCEVGWQNFNAGFYAKRENTTSPRKTGKHAGFSNLDYTEGVTNGIPDA